MAFVWRPSRILPRLRPSLLSVHSSILREACRSGFHTTPRSSATIEQDHYAVLNVPKNAHKKDVKAQFYKLSMQYHPDKNPGDAEASAKFVEINEAYSTLSDPIKRRTYDLSLPSHPHHTANPFAAPTKTGPRRWHTRMHEHNPDKLNPEEWILFRRKTGQQSRPLYDFSAHAKAHYENPAAESREQRRQARKLKTLYYREMQESQRVETRMMYTCAIIGFGVFFFFHSGLVHMIFMDDEEWDGRFHCESITGDDVN